MQCVFFVFIFLCFFAFFLCRDFFCCVVLFLFVHHALALPFGSLRLSYKVIERGFFGFPGSMQRVPTSTSDHIYAHAQNAHVTCGMHRARDRNHPYILSHVFHVLPFPEPAWCAGHIPPWGGLTASLAAGSAGPLPAQLVVVAGLEDGGGKRGAVAEEALQTAEAGRAPEQHLCCALFLGWVPPRVPAGAYPWSIPLFSRIVFPKISCSHSSL